MVLKAETQEVSAKQDLARLRVVVGQQINDQGRLSLALIQLVKELRASGSISTQGMIRVFARLG